jgi:hypothetical protein
MSGDQRSSKSTDLSSATPEEFARLVRDASISDLARALDHPELRTRILDEVFSRISRRYRGGPVNGVIHWRILDRPDGGHDLYESILSNDACTVHREQTNEPRVTLNLSGTELLRLASGERSATVMFFSGKLRITGDIRFAATVGDLFGVATA